MVQGKEKPQSFPQIPRRIGLQARRLGGINVGNATVDAEPHTAVSNVHLRRLEREMRRSDSIGGTGMQHTPCLQTIFKGAEETAVPNYM